MTREISPHAKPRLILFFTLFACFVVIMTGGLEPLRLWIDQPVSGDFKLLGILDVDSGYLYDRNGKQISEDDVSLGRIPFELLDSTPKEEREDDKIDHIREVIFILEASPEKLLELKRGFRVHLCKAGVESEIFDMIKKFDLQFDSDANRAYLKTRIDYIDSIVWDASLTTSGRTVRQGPENDLIFLYQEGATKSELSFSGPFEDGMNMPLLNGQAKLETFHDEGRPAIRISIPPDLFGPLASTHGHVDKGPEITIFGDMEQPVTHRSRKLLGPSNEYQMIRTYSWEDIDFKDIKQLSFEIPFPLTKVTFEDIVLDFDRD